MNQKVESMKRNAAIIEYLTGMAVGFPVALCIGKGKTVENEYQIMPQDEFKSGVEDFWDWHIENNEQWFATPLEAAADFVQKRVDFVKQKIETINFS